MAVTIYLWEYEGKITLKFNSYVVQCTVILCLFCIYKYTLQSTHDDVYTVCYSLHSKYLMQCIYTLYKTHLMKCTLHITHKKTEHYTVHTLCIVQWQYTHIMTCSLSGTHKKAVQCTGCTVHTLCRVHSTLHTLCRVQCTVHTLWPLKRILHTLCRMQCTVHTHNAVYTVHCTENKEV